MRPNPLEDVLPVEREIAASLEAERARPALWLDEQKRALDAIAPGAVP